MAEKCDPFTAAINIAQQAKRQPVRTAYNDAKQLLKLIPASRLDADGQLESRYISRQLVGTIRDFENNYALQINTTNSEIEKLEEFSRSWTIAQIMAVIMALPLFAFGWYVSVLLVVAALCARKIVGAKTLARVRQIAQDSWIPTREATAILGHAETAHGGSTGLYQRAETLYLGALDEAELAIEMCRREAVFQARRNRLHPAGRQSAGRHDVPVRAVTAGKRGRVAVPQKPRARALALETDAA
jgi:hypothetical protein